VNLYQQITCIKVLRRWPHALPASTGRLGRGKNRTKMGINRAGGYFWGCWGVAESPSVSAKAIKKLGPDF